MTTQKKGKPRKSELLAALKDAEKMIDGLLEGFAPEPEEVSTLRDIIARAEGR